MKKQPKGKFTLTSKKGLCLYILQGRCRSSICFTGEVSNLYTFVYQGVCRKGVESLYILYGRRQISEPLFSKRGVNQG